MSFNFDLKDYIFSTGGNFLLGQILKEKLTRIKRCPDPLMNAVSFQKAG